MTITSHAYYNIAQYEYMYLTQISWRKNTPQTYALIFVNVHLQIYMSYNIVWVLFSTF